MSGTLIIAIGAAYLWIGAEQIIKDNIAMGFMWIFYAGANGALFFATK